MSRPPTKDTQPIFGARTSAWFSSRPLPPTRVTETPSRAATAPLALATAAAGVRMPAYGELLLLVGVWVGMLAVEARSCATARPMNEPV